MQDYTKAHELQFCILATPKTSLGTANLHPDVDLQTLVFKSRSTKSSSFRKSYYLELLTYVQLIPRYLPLQHFHTKQRAILY